MPINDRYIAPEPVLRFLADGDRTFLALRLIHGLLFAFDRTVKGQMKLVPSIFPKEHRCRASLISAAVGPETARDNRWLRSACDELASQNILHSVEIEGKTVRFKLSKKFADSFLTPSSGSVAQIA
ncbi:hypothetical protein [Tropicibacter oceani]|uniref:Uncharacterized protein n=1 Tax=Tropicibacter oceani TaxID=3058420 RepID=A0ABY8QKF4_9RHOB|nr:hypothetical protein [Tropicibacter oceani]WGW05114.1 hypothetical protein QF118_06100 [Tropicibacter oceani]